MFASEPPRSAPAQRAGHVVFIIGGVIALMVAVIIGARSLLGGPFTLLSIALPLVSLTWVALIGRQVSRYRAPVEPAPTRTERPSKRPPRFETGGGPRTERTSDSGRHVSA